MFKINRLIKAVKAWGALLLLWPMILCGQDSAAPALPEDTCAEYYNQGEYELAVDCLNRFFYTSGVNAPGRLKNAYATLGASLMMLDKKPLAKAAFTKLLELDPNFEMNPNVYLPEVISMFQISKFEKKAAAAILVPAYPTWMSLVPGGVPQFYNRQKVKAGVFLGVQVVSLALSVYAYRKEQSYNSPAYGFKEEDVSRARIFDRVHTVSLITFSLALVTGVVDGLINKKMIIKAQ